jgi:hypothetical protein
MEWLKIKTSTELVRVSTDEIVYVCADGKNLNPEFLEPPICF